MSIFKKTMTILGPGIIMMACSYSESTASVKGSTFYEMNKFSSCSGKSGIRSYGKGVYAVSPAEGSNIPGYGSLKCDASNLVKINSAKNADIDASDWALFASKGIKNGDHEGVLKFIAKASGGRLAQKRKDGFWYVSKPGCKAGTTNVCGKQFNATLYGPNGMQKKIKVAVDSYCPVNHWKNAGKNYFKANSNPCNGDSHIDLSDQAAKALGISGQNQNSYKLQLNSKIN